MNGFRSLRPALLSVALILSNEIAAHADACPGNSNCTNTDISLALSATSVVDPCDFIGDTATLNVRAELLALLPRYDLGLFIALDGGNAAGGICQSGVLDPLAVPCGDGGSPLTGVGPYYNGECADPADTCGDVQSGVTTLFDTTLSLACRDLDENGIVDAAVVWSWENNTSSTCNASSPSSPATSSKCRFSSVVDIVGLPVATQTIELVKSIVAATSLCDPGLFDLQIDSITEAGSVGHLGTTGPVPVLSGARIVGELAVAPTDPGDYTSAISCVDLVGRCIANPAVRCLHNSMCPPADSCDLVPTTVATCEDCTSLSVPVPAGPATIRCTITNTPNPVTTTTTTLPASVVREFSCYKVKDLKNPAFAAQVGVTLEDAFGSATSDILKPAQLCAPVSRNGATVADALTYLCCYKTKAPNLAVPVQTETSGTFGTMQVEVKKPGLYCQPCSSDPLP